MGEVVPISDARPSVSCVPATAETITQWWDPVVRPALERIKAKQGPRATWTPAHVYHAVVRAGTAEPWWGHTGFEFGSSNRTQPVAFAITQTAFDSFQSNLPAGLFVWFAWADPRVPEAVPAMDAGLVDVARARGLEYLEAMTTRRGMGRRLQRLGWEEVVHIVRKDVR